MQKTITFKMLLSFLLLFYNFSNLIEFFQIFYFFNEDKWAAQRKPFCSCKLFRLFPMSFVS